jgi:DNA-binding transcriptional LysR family regulator
LSPAKLDVERIDLRLLRYFLAVSEELHFGRAAARLHMSQPPLSKAIRKLEDQLGVEVFVRSSRGVALTDAGRTLAVEARKVLAGVDHAVAEARRVGNTTSRLRIGSTHHLSIEPLHRFLAALEERGLLSGSEVIRIPPVEQVRGLRTGGLELGIFPDAGEQDGIETEPLFPGEPFAAYVATDHPLAERDVVGPDELSKATIVDFQPTNPRLWKRSLALLADAGYRFARLDGTVGSNDGRDALLSVARGTEVALLPASMLEASQAGSIVARLHLDPPVSMSDTVVAWRANPSRHFSRILDGVREVARELFEAERAQSDVSV